MESDGQRASNNFQESQAFDFQQKALNLWNTLINEVLRSNREFYRHLINVFRVCDRLSLPNFVGDSRYKW